MALSLVRLEIDSVAGPIFAGILLGAGMNFATMMTILGGLMLVAGFAVLCLGRHALTRFNIADDGSAQRQRG